jgi:hypothetical protein
MKVMERHDGASDADYEQLRRHLLGPHREHPVARQTPAAVSPPTDRSPVRLSVMSWLVEVGHAVARKLRGQPRSPMVRLHPKR